MMRCQICKKEYRRSHWYYRHKHLQNHWTVRERVDCQINTEIIKGHIGRMKDMRKYSLRVEEMKDSGDGRVIKFFRWLE